MDFIIENIRLKELVVIARSNKPFFDHFIQTLSKAGYPDLHSFILEVDDKKAFKTIHSYLQAQVPSGIKLLEGVGSPYSPEKGKWFLLGWIFRDAPVQRLNPMLSQMPGNSVI